MIDIKGYEGKYAVTSCGKVWSYKGGKFLKPNKSTKGYERVCLSADGLRKNFAIHKLVAIAYIPNLYNFPQVNHKDENKENNSANNLEWCTNKYNSNYGTRNARMSSAKMKKVFCVELNRIFDSGLHASSELKIDSSRISECCSGKFKTAGGYHWQYADKFEKGEPNGQNIKE